MILYNPLSGHTTILCDTLRELKFLEVIRKSQ